MRKRCLVWGVVLGLRVVAWAAPGLREDSHLASGLGSTRAMAGEAQVAEDDGQWLRVRLEATGLTADELRVMQHKLAQLILDSLGLVRRPLANPEVLVRFIGDCRESALEADYGRQLRNEMQRVPLAICPPPADLASAAGQEWQSLFLHEVGHRVLLDWFPRLRDFRACVELAASTGQAKPATECREKMKQLSDGLGELFADVYANAVTGREDGVYQALKAYELKDAQLVNRSFRQPHQRPTAEALGDPHYTFAEARAALGAQRRRDPRVAVLATFQSVREMIESWQKDPLRPLDLPALNREIVRRIESNSQKLLKK